MWVSSFVLISSSWLIFVVSGQIITNEQQCSRYCKENRNDFGYENGWVYSYKYTTNVTTFINSSSNLESLNKNVVSLSVLADIYTLSTCDYKLQLSEAQILTITKANVEKISGDLEKKLIKNPLHFSFHNGKINTVCSINDEEVEILNIKKAILSAFQHSKQYMHQRSILYETDVSGICETEYETIETESHYAVKKIKNLEACSHRSEKYFSWQPEPYNKKQASSSPLIRSTQNCLQIYENDMVLKSSICEERHIFQPFSYGEQGAITMLNQKLEFLLKKHFEPKTIFPLEFERSTLLYKKVERIVEKNSKIDDIIKLLNLLELNTNDAIKPDVSALFFRMVNALENVSKEGLVKIFESIRNSQKKKKFFLDALPSVTTTEGIEFMIILKRQDELTQVEFDSWISSLLFIKNPSFEVLQTLSALLNNVNHANQKTILTISGLLYRYCKMNQCKNNENILSIIRLLEKPLKTGCNLAQSVSQANILLALKAIGNAGITTSFGNLRACFLKPDVPTDIRLAAITAHRRINCDQNENLDYFQNRFVDIKENTEVRIASYLALMQCSSYAVFTNVKHVLYKEEINQVASFVWTHLTNLQETRCQWKQKLKHLVENEFLRNKFDTDLRKYSRNYELSYFFDSINTGVSAESNVVFTADSYLPKSGMLNLTLDLFGETVNVFEVGGRLTGFEDVVGELFGPDGYFPDNSVKTLLENSRSEHELVKKIHELGESMRSQKELKKDPSGLLYAKIFGNEISYTHFKSFNEVFGGESISKGNAIDLLRKLFSNNDVQYTKTFKFLDSTFTIPTLAGFPLEVSVNGTATLGLTLKGKVDVEDFWKQKLQLEGKIYPSAAMEIVGAMTVDAFSTKMGLKSVSTVNSNTYIDGHVFIDGGKLVDLKLNIPKKQIDIINIKSDLFLFQNENLTILEDVTSNIEEWEGCTKTLFGKITGLQFCSNYKYVNASQEKYAPYFPMTGSFKYSVNVKKVDVFDSYHLRWTSNLEPGTDLNYVSFYLDTPNSHVNRKFNVSVYLDKKGKTLEAKLEHPFATLELLCRLDNGLNVKILYNNKEIVFLESFLYLLQNEYKVDAKLNYKEKTLATISGVINNENNKYTMQFVVNDAKIRLIVIPKAGTYVVTSRVYSKELQASLNASVVFAPDMFSLTSMCSYNYKNKHDDLFLEFNIGKTKKIESVKGVLYLNFMNTFKPFYNTLISFSVERSEMYFEVVGKVVLFGVTWDTNQLLKFRQRKDYLDIALLSTLTCFQKNIDYKIIFAHNSTKHDFGLHGLIQLNRIQRMEVLVKYETHKEDRNISLLIYYPKQAWSINGELKKISVEEIDIRLKGLQETHGVAEAFLDVEGKYINSTREQLKNYTLNLVIDFVQDAYFWKSPWIISSSLQNSKDIFISSAELRSRAFNTSASVTQTKDSFRTELQLNNKKLFVVNSKKNGDETSITLGLNIYQNFEFKAKMKPYTHLDLKFYWDKDRDPNQRLFLTIVGNNNGFFVLNLEYPNQKVVASFTLLPTQVTLNVTWGLQVYQKIYLKLGNKIYDVGGIWFSELETPFKYFEKQKFRLKYLIFKQNIETETSISWRDHKINLTAAGSKSPSFLSGFVEINSTLPQIKKLGVAVSHTSSSINSTKETKTNIVFVYNEHQVTAESVWSSQRLNVLSTFQVVSSTDTIKPIYGVLIINNNETNNYFNCEFSWQGSNVSAEYKFENSRSFIVIKTPFKGVEKTKLEYALMRSPSDLVVEIEVNVLQQLNYVLFKWKDKNNSMSDVQFEIISPMTGIYQLYLKHSTLFGYLEEDLIVKQGKENETILALQIRGSINSISNVDAKLSVKALGHSLSFNIFNTLLSSIIEAKWDENSLMSNLQFKVIQNEITQIMWNVNSTLFIDFIKLRYYHIDSKYYILLKTPNGYELENSLDMEYPYEKVKNDFSFLTPTSKGGFTYEHHYKELVVNNYIKAYLNEDKIEYTGSIQFLIYTFLPSDLNLEIISTWRDPIRLKFVLSEDDFVLNRINLNILLIWDKQTTFAIDSFIKYDLMNNTLLTHVSGSHIDDIDISSSYNIDRQSLEMIVRVKNVVSTAKITWSDAYVFYVEIKSENKQEFLLDVRYDSPKFKVKILLPRYEFESNLKIHDVSVSGNFNLACPNSGNYTLTLNFTQTEGFLSAKKNNNLFEFFYEIKSTSTRNFDVALNISSTFDFFQNATMIAKYNANHLNVLLKGNSRKYFLHLQLFFSLDSTTRNAIAKGQLRSKFKIDDEEIMNTDLQTSTELASFDDSTLLIILAKSEESALNFTGYVDLLGSHRADLFVQNKDKAFTVKYENSKWDQVILSWSVNTVLHKLSGEIKSQRKIMGEDSEIQTYLKLIRDDQVYNGYIFTKYQSLLQSDSLINFISSDFEYNGFAVVNFNGSRNFLNVSLDNSVNKNNLEFMLDINGMKKLEGFLLLESGFTELSPLNISVNFNWESEVKELSVEYTLNLHDSRGIKLDVQVNKTNMWTSVDLPNHKQLLKLSGTYFLEDDEISINFFGNYNSSKIRGEIFQIKRDFVQTKVDITTTIKGWEKTVFENKIAEDKVRTFFAIKNNHLSIVANKEALFKGKDVLSVQYNGEQLLTIWSGRDRSYLITSTRYVKYRLGIQYVTDPHIYGFSILKNGENLISLQIMQNTNNSKYLSFKGKLIAPTLFPHYSNLSLHLHTDYYLGKDFEFALNNQNTELFEVKWSTKNSGKEYIGYFKFHSQIPMLELFEAHSCVNLENDVLIKSKLLFSQYGTQKELLNEIFIPVKAREIFLLLVYPCEEYSRCKFHLQLNKSQVVFSWTSPLENWKTISFNSRLELKNSSLAGSISFEKNRNIFNANINVRLNSTSFDWNFNKASNFNGDSKTYAFEGSYGFYKQINFRVVSGFLDFDCYVINDIEKVARFTVVYRDTKTRINTSLDQNKLNFLIGYDDGENGDEILTNITVVKTDVSHKSQNFDLFYFDRHTFWKGNFIYDSVDGYKFSGFLKNDTLTLKGEFSRARGNFKLIERCLPFEVLLNYNLISKVEASFYLKMENQTVSNISAVHLYSENSVNSDLLVQLLGVDLMQLNLKYLAGRDDVLGLLRVSFSSAYEISFKTNLKYDRENYFLENEILWPEGHNITVFCKVFFGTDYKLVNLEINTPYTDQFRTAWNYDVTNKKIYLLSSTSLGEKNVTVSLKLILKSYLSINITSPFVGYTTGGILAYFDENNRTVYVRIEKENLLTEFAGNVTKLENNLHEIHITSKSLAESFAEMQMKLDRNSMKFNGDIIWRDKKILVDLSYNPKDLHLNIDSSMDHVKKIRLSAVYTKNQSIYYLDSSGHWNSITFTFKGNVNLDPNDLKINSALAVENSYEGKFDLEFRKGNRDKLFEVSAYFPRPSSNVYLKFSSEELEGSIMTQIILKTPFEAFRNFLLMFENSKQKISTAVSANLLDKDFTAFMSSSFGEQNLLGKLGFSVPQDGQIFNLEFDVDLYKHGRFKFENVYEITVRYNISDNLEISLVQSKQNEVKTKVYLLYSEENFKFDWCVKDDVITVQKSPSVILVKLDSLKYLKSVTNETVFLFYKDVANRNLNITFLQMSLLVNWNDSEVNINTRNFWFGNLSAKYTVTKNGFKVLAVENDRPYEVQIFYLNSADEFLFSIDEDNKDRNILKQSRLHFRKNLEKFKVKISDNFLVDLELTENTSKLHFLNNVPYAGEFIQCEFDLTNSTFSFLLKTYSSTNINILTVIDLISKRKLQFEYGAFKNSAIKGVIELENSEMTDVLRVVFDKSGKEIFSLEYAINEDLYSAKFYVEISNLVHRGNFKLVKSDPYLIQFEIFSNILHNEGFAIFGTASSFMSMFFSVGKKIPESSDEVENQYLLITGKFQHKSILVHLEVPKCDLLRLLHYQTSWDYDIYKTFNEIKIVSSVLGNVSTVADFILEEEGLDLNVHLRLPFLQNFEKFDSKFHVHKNSSPWFYIHLPNNKNYSAHVNFVNDDDRILIAGGYIWVDSKTELTLDFNKTTHSFLAEIYLPFENYKHYALIFKKNEMRYLASVNLNERLNRFELEYCRDLRGNVLKIDLVTPFQNYDKYYLHIKQKRDSETQLFTCLLFYPGLQREIGFDLAHYFNRRINYTISLPVSVYSIKRASFSANLLKRPEYLTIDAKGELNSYDVKTSVLFDKSKNESKMNFELKTSETESIVILFNDQNDFLNTTLTYNGKNILKLDYSHSKDFLHFLCDTIWKSVKLNYEYQSLTQFNISAKVWDTSKPDHQFGGHFISTDRISMGLYLPNRTITADEQYFINSTHEFYLLRFAWNKNDAFGVKIRFYNVSEDHSINVNSLIDLELPFRTFQLFYDLKIIQSSNIFTHFIFKWDQDSASEINWRSKFIENKFESKFTSIALDNDITLAIDFCKLNTIPSIFKLQLNYSSDEEKLIEVEVFYDKTLLNDIVTVERNFLIKQPASKINYAVNSKTIRTKESANLTVFLHYTDYILNKPENIKVSLEIGHSNFEIAGLIETKRNNLNIFTKSNTGTYYKGLEIEMKVNDKEPLNLNYVYNFKEASPSFMVVMKYGNGRQYHVYTGLPSKREIKAELVHNIYGNEYIDGLFTLKLNTSSLLWLKILWTDSLIEQFSKAIISEYSDLKFVVEATGQQLIDVVDRDFGKTFVEDVRELRSKITTYGSTQKKEIIKDFSNFVQGIKEMCDRKDTLFCRMLEELKTFWEKYNVLKSLIDPIFQMITDFYDSILEILVQTYGSVVYIFDQIEQALNKLEDVQKLKDNAKELLKRSINDARKSIRDMELLAVELLNDLEEYMNAIKSKCEELFDPLLSLLDDFVVYFENKLAFVQIIVLDTFDTIQQYIQRLGETKKLIEIYRALVSWLEKLHLLELVESASDFIEAILNTVVNDTKHIIDDYRPYVDTLYATIFGDYQELKKLPEFSDFKEFINKVYQKTIWIWNYHNVMETIKAYLHKLSSSLINYLNIFASEYPGNNEQENIFGQFDYTFRPDLGIIEISQPLPVEWESFDKAPCFEQYPLYQQIHNKIDIITRNRFDVYKSTVKTYVQYITKRVFSPSINNIAMIIGNSHFISFDRNHFDFVGNCSYLLASDFYSDSFSVIINFAEKDGVHQKRSLTFLNSENKIDVMADDFGVVFNGVKVDLPLIVDDFIVTRESEYILAIENRKGLRAFCNFYFDYCTIEISEWLFGKTAGLLGTLDNEKFTDLIMPSGYRANTIEEFIDSWKLEDNCDGTNYANETKDYSGSLLVNRFFNTLCAKIFLDRKSPLSPCFDIVDSKPFYRMCLLDVRDRIKPTVCSATAAYKKQCKNQLVEVGIPNICISCQQSLEGSPILTDTIFDGHNPKSIDVVFIQELNCLKNIITNLPKKLNSVLQKKGYINNKFAIVGYGGQSSMKPHIYTFEKDIWSNENTKINVNTTFKWKPEGKYTATDAIKYAIDLNFRPALRKIFILIQCELCPEMDNSPEIYNMLGDKDIILHVLKPKPFERTKSEIFALDANNRVLSTTGVLKNVTNNDQVIDQLNDMCSGLALSTTGTLADADLLRSNRLLKSSWASFVTLSAKRSSCQKCKCVSDGNGVGKVDCTRCMSPIVKQLLNEYESKAIEF